MDFVYHFRDLNNFCIASMVKTVMPESDLWVRTEIISGLVFFSFKHSFFNTIGIEYKKILYSISHSLCIFSSL